MAVSNEPSSQADMAEKESSPVQKGSRNVPQKIKNTLTSLSLVLCHLMRGRG